jgi:hypothetical protein
MVLLLVFQRFTAEDWGCLADLNIHSTNCGDVISYTLLSTAPPISAPLECIITTRRSSNLAGESSHTPLKSDVLENAFKLTVQTAIEKAKPNDFISGVSESFPEFIIFPKDIFYKQYCSTRRGTRLVSSSRTTKVAQLSEFVLKVCWPECSRFNEVEAIEHAHGLSRQTYRQVEGCSPGLKYPFIKHHIPEMHGWRDFDHFDTSLIRLSMGLRTKEDMDNELTKGDAGTNGKDGEMLVASKSNTSVHRSRHVLRVIISTRYFPISKLEPQQFGLHGNTVTLVRIYVDPLALMLF